MMVAEQEPRQDDEGQPDAHVLNSAAAKRFAEGIASEVSRRVGLRRPIEERWIDDLRQYHGVYDPDTKKKLSARRNSSTAFINETAQKTDAMAARLTDTLFPTDEKNWGISPTPVPEMTEKAEELLSKSQEMRADLAQIDQEINDADDDADVSELEAQAEDIEQQLSQIDEIEAKITGKMDAARRSGRLMEAEIEDQFVESRFEAQARRMIDDAVKLGSGVLLGPIRSLRGKRSWSDEGDGVYKLSYTQEARPVVRWCDVWSFFPDPDVRDIEDSEENFLRHLWNKRALRKFAKSEGVNVDAIRVLLKEGTKDQAPSYLNDIRQIKDETYNTASSEYHVWQCFLSLDVDRVRDIMPEIEEEIDVLDSVDVIAWVCQGHLLKIDLHPLDSGDVLFSVFNIREDESSVFGYGIPSIMRDTQSVMSAGWRLMIDNASISAGPQVVINKQAVEPADGEWELYPFKIWLATKNRSQYDIPFEVHQIASNQADIANIISMARQFMDEETSMPAIAQGEQGATTKTSSGMSLLMNSANVVFRRLVKMFDDNVTVPLVGRFYDWNMQFSDKPHIKGDFSVEARGSSVLLVREMMAQNLMAIAIQLGGHPIYGPMIKHPRILRAIFRAHMIPASEHILSDAEIEKIVAEQTESNPEEDRLRMERELKEMQLELESALGNSKIDVERQRMQNDRAIAELRYQGEMAVAAAQLGVKEEELRTRIQDGREEREHSERKFAAEMAHADRKGPSGGGNF